MTQPKMIDISKPGGNYTATRTEIEPDKTGAIYSTSMGSPSSSVAFGINVWKTPKNQPPQLLLSFPGSHGSLHVIGKELYLALNTENRKQFLIPIEGYIHPDDKVNSTTVNINDKQVAELKQMISNLQAVCDRLTNRVGSVEAINARQAREIEELKKNNSGGSQISEQKIADIVWSKLWDSFYLIRMGMNAGWSNDPNIQGWINDLTSFIKKVK
jgi:hypothetical protein